MSRSLAQWLRQAPTWAFTAFASLAGFASYFSMYAFRKPFAAASFGHVEGWNFALDFKIALVIAQVIGYAAAKFIGISVVSRIVPVTLSLAYFRRRAASADRDNSSP